MVKVLYVGIDDAYFQNLQKHFKRKFEEEFEFIKLWHQDPDTFQKIVVQILEEQPNIAFLDYSASPLKMLTLARCLPRILNRGATLIGLWDYLADPLLIRESNTTGVPFNHIKSGEYSDLIIQSMFLYKGDGKFPKENFAKAEVLKVPVALEARHAMRIGFMTKDYVHIEHDIDLPENKTFELSCQFDRALPVNKFRVARSIDENYYYNFSHVSDIEFVTEVVYAPKENETDLEKDWRERDMRERSLANEKKVQDFVESTLDQSKPKRTRVLVIDPQLQLLRHSDKPIDSYRHSIRFIRYLRDTVEFMKQVRAGIICYCCEDFQDGEIVQVMNHLSTLPNYKPFVVIYGTNHSSEHLKNHFKYDRIVAYPGEFNLSQLLGLCDVYSENDGKKKANEGKATYHDQEERVYIDKNSKESYLYYPFAIELREFSESWLTFQSTEKLPRWGIFELSNPVPMCITVIALLDEKEWSKEGWHQYLAIIHSVGETDKAQLRQNVNQMIYDQSKVTEENDEEEKDGEEEKQKEDIEQDS